MPRKNSPSGRLAEKQQLEEEFERLHDAMQAGDQQRAAEPMASITGAGDLAVEVARERLIQGRSRMPGFDLEFLMVLAGDKVESVLRAISNDRSAADILRFGARRRLGWPERTERKARRDFLKSLADPDGTLVEAVVPAMESPIPSGDIVAEVLAYMKVLPDRRNESLVRRIVEDSSCRYPALLHALMHLNAPHTQKLVLDELTRIKHPASAAAISRLGRTTGNEALRIECEAALRRLQLQVVGQERDEPVMPLPPCDIAIVTQLDGEGGQALLLRRMLSGEYCIFVNFFHNELVGVKDVYGRILFPTSDFDSLVDDFSMTGLLAVEVGPEVVRGILDRAVEVNAAAGYPLPPEFELWEPMLHDSCPPAAGETDLYPELDDSGFAGEEPTALEIEALLDNDFCESWRFGFEETLDAMDGVPEPEYGQLTDVQFRPLLKALVTDDFRQRILSRLRRQAWLLEHEGLKGEATTALKASASIAAKGLPELYDNLFLKAFVGRSVDFVLTVDVSGILDIS